MPAGMCLCDGEFHSVSPLRGAADGAGAPDGAVPEPACPEHSDRDCPCACRSIERARVTTPPLIDRSSVATITELRPAEAVVAPRANEPSPSHSRGDPPLYLVLRTLLI